MRFKPDLRWSDITPKADFLSRRQIMAGGVALMAGMGSVARAGTYPASPLSTDETPNSLSDISTYNNYYEFGLDKADPANNARMLKTDPWSILIGGMVDKPGRYDLADILKDAPIQERIYRFRCVEAWSMVIPWAGFELSHLLGRVGVQPSAKYVAFETVNRPDEMPGLSNSFIDWPYREGLRLESKNGACRQGAAQRQDAIDLGVGEEKAGDGLLGRGDIVGRVGLGEDFDIRICGKRRIGSLAAVIAHRNAGRAIEDQDLALAANGVDQELGGLVTPLVRVSVDLRSHVLAVDETVEIDDCDTLGAGIGHDARRSRR